MSGYPSDVSTQHGIGEEGVNFITKPVHPFDLLYSNTVCAGEVSCCHQPQAAGNGRSPQRFAAGRLAKAINVHQELFFLLRNISKSIKMMELNTKRLTRAMIANRIQTASSLSVAL
jgi:hypothetical protein